MLEYVKLLLTVILGSGAAIAIVRLIFDSRKEKRDRLEAVKYLAIQLAFQFEGFTMECAQGVSDHQTAIQYDGHAGKLLGRVPNPPQLPTSDAYRFLDSEIMNSVFGFSQRCQMAQLAADFWMDVVGEPECYRTAVEENTVSMGADALGISRTIRTKYQLGDRILKFDKWNIDDFIRDEMEKLRKRLAHRDKIEREDAACDAD
jgi:hypothetical protein